MTRRKFDAQAWVMQEIRSTVFRTRNEDPTDIDYRIESAERMAESATEMGLDASHELALRDALTAMKADPSHPLWLIDTSIFKKGRKS